MQELKFKTTLTCGGCESKIAPGMDAIHGIEEWKVDLESSDKTMTVKASEDVLEEIKTVFGQKGFEATLL